MGASNFDNHVLELKRKKFFEVVHSVCELRKLPTPTINFEYCQEEDENQLAHYHPYLNKICVSKRQLMKLNLDEIENTATHEVAHIFEHNHDAGFQDEHEKNKIAAWRPPGGVVVLGNERKTTKKISKAARVDTKHCNYHLCRIKATLNKCAFCKNFFCEEHSKPRPSGMPAFDSTDAEDILFIQESREPNAHPCAPYYDHLQETAREKQIKYQEALDKLIRTPTPSVKDKTTSSQSYAARSSPQTDYTDTPFIKRIAVKRNENDLPTKSKKYKKYLIWAFILAIAAFIIINRDKIFLLFS